MSTYPQLIQGSTGWLYDVVSEQCTVINAELSQAIKGGTAPQFSMYMGVPLNPAGPTIAVTYASTARKQELQYTYQFYLRFRVMVLIPHAGDDSAEAFEMARQVAADNLQSLFTDETRTLCPVIDAGATGTISAFCTSFSNVLDLFPRKSADGKTVLRGFEIPFTMSFMLAANA